MSRHFERGLFSTRTRESLNTSSYRVGSKSVPITRFYIGQRRGPAFPLSCILHEVRFGYRVARERGLFSTRTREPLNTSSYRIGSKSVPITRFYIGYRRGPAFALSCILHEVRFGYRFACVLQKLLQEFPWQMSAYDSVVGRWVKTEILDKRLLDSNAVFIIFCNYWVPS